MVRGARSVVPTLHGSVLHAPFDEGEPGGVVSLTVGGRRRRPGVAHHDGVGGGVAGDDDRGTGHVGTRRPRRSGRCPWPSLATSPEPGGFCAVTVLIAGRRRASVPVSGVTRYSPATRPLCWSIRLGAAARAGPGCTSVDSGQLRGTRSLTATRYVARPRFCSVIVYVVVSPGARDVTRPASSPPGRRWARRARRDLGSVVGGRGSKVVVVSPCSRSDRTSCGSGTVGGGDGPVAPAVRVQVHGTGRAAPVLDTNVRPGGVGSVTTTSAAFDGPWFVTVDEPGWFPGSLSEERGASWRPPGRQWASPARSPAG